MAGKPKRSLGNWIYEAVFRASIEHPRRAAIFVIGAAIYLTWVRYQELRLVFEFIRTQVQLQLNILPLSVGLTLNGNDVIFPFVTLLAKIPVSFALAGIIVATIDGAVFFPFRRYFQQYSPGLDPRDLPQVLDLHSIVTRQLKILKAYVPVLDDSGAHPSAHADYAADMKKAVRESRRGRAIKILAHSGRGLIGDREHSVLWPELALIGPGLQLEIILVDPDVDTAIDERIREIRRGISGTESERDAFKDHVVRTRQALKALHADVKVWYSAMAPSLGLVICTEAVFLGTAGPGVTLDRAPWYMLAKVADQACLANSLDRLFDLVKLNSRSA